MSEVFDEVGTISSSQFKSLLQSPTVTSELKWKDSPIVEPQQANSAIAGTQAVSEL